MFIVSREYSESNLKPMKNDDFKHLYDLFVRNYLHYDPAYGLLIQTPFFNKLYEQWIAEHNPSLFQQNQLKHISYLIDSPFFEKCYEESLRERGSSGVTIHQKVLECLAIHRSVTKSQIKEYLKLKY